MLLRAKKEWCVSSIIDFVKTFELQQRFLNMKGVSIDDWEFDEFDSDVIGELLEKQEGKFYFTYNDSGEDFTIIQFE